MSSKDSQRNQLAIHSIHTYRDELTQTVVFLREVLILCVIVGWTGGFSDTGMDFSQDCCVLVVFEGL